MRVVAIVFSSLLAHACTHVAPVRGDPTGSVGACDLHHPCGVVGGGGADAIVSLAVVGAVVGVIGFAAIRRLIAGDDASASQR